MPPDPTPMSENQRVSQLAIAYQEEIEVLRRRWRAPDAQYASVRELFDRFYPEYNTWLLQFRTLREEAGKTLSAKLELPALMQQAALSPPTPAAPPASPAGPVVPPGA